MKEADDELGAAIKNARLLISNDTGVSHIAAGVHTPSIVVSSGADVERWAPLDQDLHKVFWHDVPCRPCAYVTCPFDHACAKGVDVETVWNGIEKMLDKSSNDIYPNFREKEYVHLRRSEHYPAVSKTKTISKASL